MPGLNPVGLELEGADFGVEDFCVVGEEGG